MVYELQECRGLDLVIRIVFFFFWGGVLLITCSNYYSILYIPIPPQNPILTIKGPILP